MSASRRGLWRRVAPASKLAGAAAAVSLLLLIGAALDGHIPAALVQRALRQSLRGEVTLERLQWRPPTGLRLTGLRLLAAPTAPPNGPAPATAAARPATGPGLELEPAAEAAKTQPAEARNTVGPFGGQSDNSRRRQQDLLLSVTRAEATLNLEALGSRRLHLTGVRARDVYILISPPGAG